VPGRVGVHANRITEWKRQFRERAADVFGSPNQPTNEPAIDLKALHGKIGQTARAPYQSLRNDRNGEGVNGGYG
jgi:hypothetical protein